MEIKEKRKRRKKSKKGKGKERTETYCEELPAPACPPDPDRDSDSGGLLVICSVSWIRVRGYACTRAMARTVEWMALSSCRSRTPVVFRPPRGPPLALRSNVRYV